MRAILLYSSVRENHHDVAEPATGHSVRYIDRRFIPDHFVESLVNLELRHWIKCCGGLIQHDKGSLQADRSRDGQLLGLTAGEFHAASLKNLENLCVEFLRQLVDELCCS